MAFTSNTRRQSQAPSNQDESWKAQGFINLSLPREDGQGLAKLGAIPLRQSNVKEARLLAWLMENPERAQILLKKLVIDFRSAEPQAGAGFDLSDAPSGDSKKDGNPPF